MFKKACVDDRVWSVKEGWGTITEIVGDKYAITVTFDHDGETETFTKTGLWHKSDRNPSIYWDEIPIPESATIRPNSFCIEGEKYTEKTIAAALKAYKPEKDDC